VAAINLLDIGDMFDIPKLDERRLKATVLRHCRSLSSVQFPRSFPQSLPSSPKLRFKLRSSVRDGKGFCKSYWNLRINVCRKGNLIEFLTMSRDVWCGDSEHNVRKLARTDRCFFITTECIWTLEKEELENIARNLFYIYKSIYAAKRIHYKEKD